MHTSMFNSLLHRRKFITNSVKATGSFALLSTQLSFISDKKLNKQYTVQEIIDTILKEGNLSTISDTVDTIKSGDANQIVTGIVTTMFPTIAVIKESVKHNANFIIAHEPTFYNHRDDKDWVNNNDTVNQKQELLDKNSITIWRFHDYCHSLKPDAIIYGMVKKAGWLSYFKTDENILTIPKISLHNLVLHLKSSLNIAYVRVIGNLHAQCENVAVMPGAFGGQKQVGLVEAKHPDVLIVGEVSEWETAEYIRDSQLLGKKTALIILGHAVSEEPGMEYVAEWLRPMFSSLNITHIPSYDPFTWL